MPEKWSAEVTEKSDALTLEEGVFESEDPEKIAASLKRSAEKSHRRKSEPFRSAMSMLTFYINRAGKNLPASQKKVLEQAKVELRKEFGRE
ncbi:DUF3175 domain-containing protein [Mesorhizobium retamae]|uniref:DUF3175 domain-containing protein n=1 Tax=Mesorhizobium retamae TaxID=2912854 RepID=A0ABS9QEU4_9HYPH|nr:DUF3175 domain-containing protein [Mesorhizobium sp. IRAMC:0171]MCG7505939.1 DUF3175 domain-containing protein [Mesorhizobium sp. IRAMC:0171]